MEKSILRTKPNLTTFKRKSDGVLFYLGFYPLMPNPENKPLTKEDVIKAGFKLKDLKRVKPGKADFMKENGIGERYYFEEIINNPEFEMVNGDQSINCCWTAKRMGEIVRVNDRGELIRNPRMLEGAKFEFLGKTGTLDSIGSWDDKKKAYRILYTILTPVRKEMCGYDSDL